MKNSIDELNQMVEEAAKDWLSEYVEGAFQFAGLVVLSSDNDDGWQYGRFRAQYDTGYVEFEAKVYAEYHSDSGCVEANSDTFDVWNIKGYSVEDMIENEIDSWKEANHE